MRHICRFALFPAFFTLLSGCGDMENTGTSAFNPATDVDPTFSTFTLKDENDIQNLKHTRFWDFYRGIEPDADANTANGRDQGAAEALATALRHHIDVIIGAHREEGATQYNSVRNPLDLMNQVIASGQIANFRDGRRYISERIDAGVSGVYSNRINGATIRFTDQEATLEGEALANRVWIYPTLDWRYLPEGPEDASGLPVDSEDGQGLDDKVYRTIQYVARQAPEEETATPPQLVSLLSGSRFNALTFATDGYNAAEFTLADFTTRHYGSVEFGQDFISDKYDEFYLRDVEGNLNEENRILVQSDTGPIEVDCLRAELHYGINELRIYTSVDEPRTRQVSGSPEDTEDNPAHCSNKPEGDETVIYSVQGVAERAQ